MADQPTIGNVEDPGSPYIAPKTDLADPWSVGPPEALALRRAHRREESLVKGLAIANLFYTLFFGVSAVIEASSLIGHLTGRMNAPWMVRPARIVMSVLMVSMAVAALGATWGFLRRKRSALGYELALAVCWFLFVAIDPFTLSTPRPALAYLGLIAAHLMLAAPMLSVWSLQRSVLFDAEYSEVIAETRHLWFWPKVSLKVILVSFAFFVVACVLIGLSQGR
jgi:biotin transporter BioY